MKKIILVLMFLFVASFAMDLMAQCPMCKTSLEEARKNGSNVGNSLNMGILYLLALPYTVAAVFGVIWWRNMRAKASRS